MSKVKSNKKQLSVEEKYKNLDPIEHVLVRPGMYVGTIDTNNVLMWVLDEDIKKFVKSEILFSAGLYKIFDEILVNAYDHSVRNKSCKNIKVYIDKTEGRITVINDGPGIEIEFHKDKQMYVPELIFSNLRTSSTYDESNKITGGMNGLGAKLTNIFSKEFKIETVDSERGKFYSQTFSNNMKEKTEPVIKSSSKASYTSISFIPDFEKFKFKNLTEDTISLFSKRVYDIAVCTNKSVNVYLNDEKIECKDLQTYINMYYSENQKITYMEVNERWKVGVLFDADAGCKNFSFVNSVSTYNGGTHVKYLLTQLTDKLLQIIQKKNKDLKVKPDQIKSNITIFIICSVEDPSFNSQVKDQLTTKSSDFGSKCELPDEFITKFSKSGIIEEVISIAEFKENKELKKSDGKKQKTLKDIDKLDDAEDAGGPNSNNCRLILTEGDSAKSFALDGLEIIGSTLYGVFPLRGKLLNVRKATVQQLVKNEEFINIKRILGLKQGTEYKDTKELRYGGIIILTDQDVDGSHIRGLIINLIHFMWPSLIIHDGFIQCLRTPLLKIYKGSDKKKDNPKIFYSLNEYKKWQDENQNEAHKWSEAKYYKGLGTSSSLEAKEAFLDFDNKKVNFICEFAENKKLDKKKIDSDEESDDSDNSDTDDDIDADLKSNDTAYSDDSDPQKKKLRFVDKYINLAFAKKKEDDRKLWLSKHDPDDILEMIGNISYKDFINKDLIHFSAANNIRSIPSIIDGLKPGQRKIMFAGFKRGKNASDIKVFQFAGYIGNETGYHHGDKSLNETIIGMAQNYTSSNNINLLNPIGNFGSRRQLGEDASSSRYIFTNINKLMYSVFRQEDDPVLSYINEEGMIVEPETYFPILPMILVNGSIGIGTGYATLIPQFNPIDIVTSLRTFINGTDYEELVPYYRGFIGNIKKIADKRYSVEGIYEVIDDTKVHITEIPIDTSLEDYRKFLNTLTLIDKKDDNIKKKLVDYVVKPFNNCVDIVVEFKSSELQKLIKVGELEKYLKLNTTICTTNMHLYNANKKITKYDSAYEILEEFFNSRFKLYEIRKEHTIKVLENDANIAKYKRMFIEYILEKKIIIERQKKDVIIDRLVELKFPKLAKKVNVDESEKSYSYLIDLPLWSLTYEKIEQLKKELEDYQKILDDYKEKTIEDIWNSELDEFIVNYKKWLLDLKEIQDKEEKLKLNEKGKKKGKKVKLTKK